jgi:hypothetical protein
MSAFLHDVRYAVRQLGRGPGFTAIALLVLALGMAGPAIIFSIVNHVFLKPWPFREPERLVDLNEAAPKRARGSIGIAWPDFGAWRAHNTTFAGMGHDLDGRALCSRLRGHRLARRRGLRAPARGCLVTDALYDDGVASVRWSPDSAEDASGGVLDSKRGSVK